MPRMKKIPTMTRTEVTATAPGLEAGRANRSRRSR
jgi:hypothetical protein